MEQLNVWNKTWNKVAKQMFKNSIKSEQMLHRLIGKNVLQLKKTNHKTLEFLLDLLLWEEPESAVQLQHNQELRDSDYFPGIATDLTNQLS